MSILGGVMTFAFGRGGATVAVPAPARVASPPPPPMDPRGVATDPGSARFTGPVEDREADRFVPYATATVLTLADGRRVRARIVNVSRTGVAVESEPGFRDPAQVATVGNRRVRPGRRLMVGMVFLFDRPLDARQCNPDIVL